MPQEENEVEVHWQQSMADDAENELEVDMQPLMEDDVEVAIEATTMRQIVKIVIALPCWVN